MHKIRKYRNMILLVIDTLIIFLSYIVVSFLTNSNEVFFSNKNVELIRNTIAIAIIVHQIFFNLAMIYKNITRYENGKDYLIYMLLCLISGTIIIAARFMFRLPLLDYKQIILAMLVITIGIISYRVGIRMILNMNSPERDSEQKKKNLLIIGAGDAARDIIKTIKTKMKNEYNIVGIIDDNENKISYLISGVKILGDRYKIVDICKENKVDTIFFSIANISSKDKKEIIELCQQTGAQVRVLPGTQELIKGKNAMQSLRSVEIEDLLGRDPITLDNKNIESLIKDKPILVTGGGGSIGSELCRQIITYKPSKLIIFDIYENNLYNIEIELKSNKQFKNVEIVPIVGSVRDVKKLEKVFKDYNPYLVFHAAAHKHVPLMEGSPLEAIKNNVFGTYNVANCADKFGSKKFILISTDKAVNPTNIMGASKRICEMIIQAKSKTSKTEFAAVRFGNVLGSNGSVIPLFKKQIEKGGPVTVTHKEITRFFMTIPEAVGLVLQAMSYAQGGEIFVLDMGEPVKIYDLAVSLIKLSGLEPNVDIPIEVTGLRPGEKLYEELLMQSEGLEKTEHDKIFIGELEKITEEQLEEKITTLRKMVEDEEITLEEIKFLMHGIVPTYHEPEEANKQIKNSRKEIISFEKIKKLATENKEQSNTQEAV